MHTQKFIKLSHVHSLQDAELRKVKGGKEFVPLYGIIIVDPPTVKPPLPQPLYGINPVEV